MLTHLKMKAFKPMQGPGQCQTGPQEAGAEAARRKVSQLRGQVDSRNTVELQMSKIELSKSKFINCLISGKNDRGVSNMA